MNELHTVSTSGVSTCVIDFNDERRVHWLVSDYSDPVWTIKDTHGFGKVATIDFRYMLADGRLLVDTERLYATVKEYAWWIRDDRYSRIDCASIHRTFVHYIMKIAHALTLRKFASFAHLQPYDITELVEEIRYGADPLLRAFDRVDKYLQELELANEADPKPYGGLPEYVTPSTGVRSRAVHTAKILNACYLPSGASTLPRVSARIAQAAKSNGMRVTSNSMSTEIPQLRIQTTHTIRQWLETFQRLYDMRRQIKAEAITFDPFPYGASRVASVKGVDCERTPTPPPKLMLYLLENSARWIFDQSADVTVCPNNRLEVIQMSTACWIIIAAFTARRAEEIDSLSEECIKGNDNSGYWLHVYIEKSLQQKVVIPVPSLVARAVEVMLKISASARRDTESDRLFQWQQADGNIIQLDVTQKIDDFAELVKVPQHIAKGKVACNWHWHPHQFRRFLAVLYFYRYEGATIEVLSHHLGHFDLEMTKRYVTNDPELASLWTDVEWGYAGHIARSIVAGERAVSGSAGEWLKRAGRKIIDGFRRKLQVISVDRVGESLKMIMQRKGMVLTPKPWVTCSCPRTEDAANLASCRRETTDSTNAVGPDFVYASPLVCSSCPHAITEGNRTFVIDDEVTHLEAATKSEVRAHTVLGNLESVRLVGLSKLRSTRYKGAKPLHPAVSVQEEA